MAERIGRARCPVCAFERASLSVSRKGLSYVTCPVPRDGGCGQQTFARSDASDARLRALHLADEAPVDAADAALESRARALEARAADDGPADPPRRGGLFDMFGFR